LFTLIEGGIVQKLTISELQSLINEYKSKGITTDDLEKKLLSLQEKQNDLQQTVPMGHCHNKPKSNGGSIITFSTGPIDPKIDKLSKQARKKCN
jgi:hypothetical protein